MDYTSAEYRILNCLSPNCSLNCRSRPAKLRGSNHIKRPPGVPAGRPSGRCADSKVWFPSPADRDYLRTHAKFNHSKGQYRTLFTAFEKVLLCTNSSACDSKYREYLRCESGDCESVEAARRFNSSQPRPRGSHPPHEKRPGRCAHAIWPFTHRE